MTNADQTSPQSPGSGSAEPAAGGYEAPPIEQSDAPAYLPPPAYDYPPPPGSYPPPPAYPPPPVYPPSPAGYLPPPVYPQAPNHPPPAYGVGYPPAAPGYPGYPGGYGPPRTNQLAIWSLVASALGFICCISSAVGVVLGVMALNQITERQEGGRGLAVAGIAVGGVSLLIGLLFTGLVINS